MMNKYFYLILNSKVIILIEFIIIIPGSDFMKGLEPGLRLRFEILAQQTSASSDFIKRLNLRLG